MFGLKNRVIRWAILSSLIALLAFSTLGHLRELDSRCYNGGNKHLFSPRYSKILPGSVNGEGITVELLEAMTDKVYIKDICVWCGDEIKK